jgi:hypothetical protein
VETRAGEKFLFHLAEDIGETTNLAAKKPEKLRELNAAFSSWSDQMETPRWIRQDRSNAEVGGKLKKTSTRKRKKTLKSIFTKADKNGDSKLSNSEFWAKETFRAVDANADGFVTIEELRAYYAKRRSDSR